VDRRSMGQAKTRASEKNHLVVLKRPDPVESAPGAEAPVTLEQLGEQPPDVLIVELVLAGRDCREMVQRLGKDYEVNSIQAFGFGAQSGPGSLSGRCGQGGRPAADPSGPDALRAVRVRVVPKHDTCLALLAEGMIRHGDLAVHPGRREVFVKGQRVRLSTCKLDILLCLARRPGWVFTPLQLIDACRGEDANVLPSSMRAHISAIRKALGPAGDAIQTVPGIGYRLRDGD